MITGVYANSNYDAQKAGEAAPRDEIVKTIDEGFNERIAQIYGTEIETSIERVEKHFAGSPFFRSVRASTMLTPRERAELLASL
jgi:hypothetical protein